MKKLINNAKNHIKCNRGDGYVMFLMIVLCSVIFFSAIFGIMKIRVEATTIYDQIENAADFVISEMKEKSYKQLIKGDTQHSVLPYASGNHPEVLKDIAELLQYDTSMDSLTSSEFIKNDVQGSTVYKIYDVFVIFKDGEGSGTGTLEMSFKVDIPVYLNGQLLTINTEEFTKITTFNFKH